MERISESVPDCDKQSLQHYISSSTWDASTVFQRIGRDADAIIGHDADSCLIVNVTGFNKASQKSVGVARHQLGRKPVTGSAWVNQQPEEAWKLVIVRHSTKGFIKLWTQTARVWLWDGKEKHAHQ